MANPAQPVTDDGLRAELLEMYAADQEVRMRSLGRPSEADARLMGELDERHTARMKEIVGERGWPGVSLVGRDGANAAWLLVQHADHDVAFQRRVLELLRGAVERGEARADHAAYLLDRVAVNEGRAQRYGTQGRCEAPGRWESRPLEEPGRVDELRASVGLQPLREYRELMNGYCP